MSLQPVSLTDPVAPLFPAVTAASLALKQKVALMTDGTASGAAALLVLEAIKEHADTMYTAYSKMPGQLPFALPAYSSSMSLASRPNTQTFGESASAQFGSFTSAFTDMASALTTFTQSINATLAALSSKNVLNVAELDALEVLELHAKSTATMFTSRSASGLAGIQAGYGTLQAMALSQFCNAKHSPEFQAVLATFFKP